MTPAEALEKRMDELARRCARAGGPCCTRFLEPAQEDAARAAAARAGVDVAFWGGCDGAERRVAAFFRGEPPAPGEWPIAAIRLTWNAKFADPGHRDLLGAVMALGIERETTGDIRMGLWRGAPCACLFALREMADYIAASLDRAGRAALKAAVTAEPPPLLPPEGTELRLTVQQPRLDALLAAAFRLSRAEAQRLVAGGLVRLNHAPCLRPDARLCEGDLVSARGHGRVRVTAFEGESRRGRQVVRAFRYGK